MYSKPSKAVAILTMAALCMMISLACGGGGGGGGTKTISIPPSSDNPSPTISATASPTASPSPSPSPSLSPSQSPSPTPTPTPTPTPFRMKGNWAYRYDAIPVKADFDAGYNVHMLVNEDGSVVPEPPQIGQYPMTVGGEFYRTSNDPETYTGTLFLKLRSDAEPEEVQITGIMSADGNTMDITIGAFNTLMNRVSGIEEIAAEYLVESFAQLGTTGKFMFDSSDTIEITSDGQLKGSEADSQSADAWSFRGNFLYALMPIMIGEAQVGEFNIFVRYGLIRKLDGAIGEFGNGWIEGNVFGEQMNSDIIVYGFDPEGTNFTLADLNRAWAVIRIEEDAAVPFQIPSFTFNDTGDILPLPAFGILGGSAEISNAAIGTVEINIAIQTDIGLINYRIDGRIAPSRKYVAGDLYQGTEESSDEIVRFFVADAGDWNYAGRDSWWCFTMQEHNGQTQYGQHPIPPIVVNGHCGADGVFDALPTSGDVEYSATMVLIGPNTYSVVYSIRENTLDLSLSLWVVGNINERFGNDTQAFVRLSQYTGGMDVHSTITGSLYAFDSRSFDFDNYVGTYYPSPTDGYTSAEINNDMNPTISFDFAGTIVVYSIEFDHDIVGCFRLYTMDGDRRIYQPGNYFVTPIETVNKEGIIRFSNNANASGIASALR